MTHFEKTLNLVNAIKGIRCNNNIRVLWSMDWCSCNITWCVTCIGSEWRPCCWSCSLCTLCVPVVYRAPSSDPLARVIGVTTGARWRPPPEVWPLWGAWWWWSVPLDQWRLNTITTRLGVKYFSICIYSYLNTLKKVIV